MAAFMVNVIKTVLVRVIFDGMDRDVIVHFFVLWSPSNIISKF
jgi:hypothetical protein